MDSLGLEQAVKSIFVQCLQDTEIMQELRQNIQEDGRPAMPERKLQPSLQEASFGMAYAEILQKLDEILALQRNMTYAEKADVKSTELEDMKQQAEGFKKKWEDAKEHSDKLETEKRNYVNALNETTKKLQACEELLNTMQQQKDSLTIENTQLKTVDQMQKTELAHLKQRYADCVELAEIWAEIQSLGEEQRDYLSQLCGGDGMLAIMSLGREEGKLEQLWNYLKDIAVKAERNEKTIAILNHYFEFCVDACNAAKADGEQYQIVAPEIGSEFDFNKQIRTADSKQFGEVQEVFVKSVLAEDGLKFKAIVKVE